LGRPKPIEETIENRVKHSNVPIAARVLNDLNSILESKSEKTYPGTTWLLIRNAFPLWEYIDFHSHLNEIIIPKCNHFEIIWLLCDLKGLSGAIKLYGSDEL
jgi:hypothetical protein